MDAIEFVKQLRRMDEKGVVYYQYRQVLVS